MIDSARKWKGNRPDTSLAGERIVRDEGYGELPSVVGTTRQCLAVLPLERVTSSSLPVMLEVALTAHDDALFDAIVAREVAESRDTTPRGQASAVTNLLLKMSGYPLQPHPNRPDLFDRYRDTVAARWPTAVGQRMSMVLMSVAWRFNVHRDTASATADEITRMVSEIRKVAALKPSEPLPPIEESTFGMAALMSASWEAYATALRENPEVAEVRLSKLFDSTKSEMFRGMGEPLPPISGQFWYHPNGDTTRMYRRPGHPALVMMVNDWILDGCSASKDRAAECAEYFFVARHFLRKFPGLDAVLVGNGLGLVRHRDIVLRWQRPDPGTMREAAEADRDYYHRDLALRAAVVVDTVSHVTIPDGRWEFAPSSTQRRFLESKLDLGTFITAFLVDADGRLLYKGPFNYNDRVMMALVKKMTQPAEPTVAPAAGRPAAKPRAKPGTKPGAKPARAKMAPRTKPGT